jgi:predicted GNAT family acetyltransferase
MNGTEERAKEWRHGQHAAVCDVLEPWAHGTVARATRYPNYWDFNAVCVERDPGMGAEQLAAVADEYLGDLAHRRVDVEIRDVADRLRPGFESLGWDANTLVWMLHTEPVPPGEAVDVQEVDYDAVLALREAWHYEDFPNVDYGGHAADAKAVSMARDVQVFAVLEAGEPIAFAQVERAGDAAEVAQVFVRADRRGGGMGTSLTRAAIAAAGRVDDLWIVADDEGRPKELYARLGFRPAWRMIEFQRPPQR